MENFNVEVLLSTYNGETYIEEQLNSLINQTYTNFTVLIRDDGSKDGTLNILKNYIRSYPAIFRLLDDSQGNLGASSSFYSLIENSTGDYIMLCDQDDVWIDTKIEDTLRFMLQHELKNTPTLIYTDLIEVDRNLQELNKSFLKSQKIFPLISDIPEKIMALNSVAGCTAMFNSISKKILLPGNRTMVHDQWIAVNIAHYGNVHFMNKSTILYRQHSNNVMGAHTVGLSYFKSKLIDGLIQRFKQLNNNVNSFTFTINFYKVCLYKIAYTLYRLF